MFIFPAAAAEKAADQIIDRVTNSATGNGTAPAATPQPQPPPQSFNDASQSQPNVLRQIAANIIDQLVPVAYAQASANIDITSSEIRVITASMQTRFEQLEKYFVSGAVGLTNTGLVEVREAASVALAERAVVKRLVAEDNRDRNALYAEIARANAHPEWEDNIRKIFARRWVERGAKTGWYYQNAAGAWVQK